MIQTIYIHTPAFFPDRHRTFILEISRRFKLIVPKNNNFEFAPNAKVEFAEDITGEVFDEATMSRYLTEKRALIDYAQNLFAELAPGLNIESPFNPDSTEIEGKLVGGFRAAEVFKRIASHRKIDMVILSAEYGYSSRPIRIEAAHLNIPCVNIEHGYYIFAVTPDLVKDLRDVWAAFTSDFVVLDNAYQAALMAGCYTQKAGDNPPRFLPLGTPIDSNSVPLIDPEIAAQTLGISRDHYIVTLMGTWIEPRELLAPFQHQIDEGEYYERVFATVKRSSGEKEIHLIIKMHPTMAHFPEAGDHEYFRQLALANGIDKITILTASLYEILSISDVVFFSNFSSVIQDCLLLGIPSAILIPESWSHFYFTENYKNAQGIGKSGQLDFLINDHDIDRFIERYRSNSNRLDYKAKNSDFVKELGLHSSDVLEKSRRICDWIEAHLNETIAGVGK